jgi:hypothetical protein
MWTSLKQSWPHNNKDKDDLLGDAFRKSMIMLNRNQDEMKQHRLRCMLPFFQNVAAT